MASPKPSHMREMIEYPRPPAHVQPYVDILGPKGAMDFLLTFGGSEVYLTTNPKTRSMLVERIGHLKTVALAEALGSGLKIRVPTAKSWIACCLHAEGLKTAEIARRLHMSDTVVREWIKKGFDGSLKYDPRQMSLF